VIAHNPGWQQLSRCLHDTDVIASSFEIVNASRLRVLADGLVAGGHGPAIAIDVLIVRAVKRRLTSTNVDQRVR